MVQLNGIQHIECLLCVINEDYVISSNVHQLLISRSLSLRVSFTVVLVTHPVTRTIENLVVFTVDAQRHGDLVLPQVVHENKREGDSIRQPPTEPGGNQGVEFRKRCKSKQNTVYEKRI